MKKTFLFFTIAFLILTVTLNAQVTDIDGLQYKTVKIDTLIWMAENLNVSHFRNGDPIPEVEDAGAWAQAGQEHKPAWCYYDSNPANGRTHHKLYNWYAVNDKRGLAPKGWHVPSKLEWANLTDYLGGDNVAGSKLKATYGWLNNGKGTNESGLAGLPGGYRYFAGKFYNIGQDGYWWSSSQFATGGAWYRYLNCFTGNIYGNYDFEGGGYCVRCVKDYNLIH